MKLSGIRCRDGHALLHPEFSYTVNQMPGQTGPVPMIARRVAPPLERGAGTLDGWVRLTWGDPLDRVNGAGWQLGLAELDEEGDFLLKPGNHLLMNLKDAEDLVLPMGEDDGRLRCSLFLPSGGGVGIGLPSGAFVELRDQGSSPPAATIQVVDVDGTTLGAWPVEFWFGPGQWQTLDLDYEGPRFDDFGRQLDHGRISGIYLDDIAVGDPVTLPLKPSATDRNTMRFLGDIGPGGISNIQFNAVNRTLPNDGLDLMSQRTLDDVSLRGDLKFERQDDRIILDGEGEVAWPEALPDSIHLAARVRFKTGTAASLDLGDGVVVHLGHGDVGDPATGTIVGVDEVTTHLVAAGSWFNLEVRIDAVEASREVTVRLNGVVLSSGTLTASEGVETGPVITLEQGLLEFSSLRLLPGS